MYILYHRIGDLIGPEYTIDFGSRIFEPELWGSGTNYFSMGIEAELAVIT